MNQTPQTEPALSWRCSKCNSKPSGNKPPIPGDVNARRLMRCPKCYGHEIFVMAEKKEAQPPKPKKKKQRFVFGNEVARKLTATAVKLGVAIKGGKDTWTRDKNRAVLRKVNQGSNKFEHVGASGFRELGE